MQRKCCDIMVSNGPSAINATDNEVELLAADGKTIAHGYLTLSLILSLTANFLELDNLERAINFGANKVRFFAPVQAGARVRARGTVLQARSRGGALLLTSEIRIEIEDDRKPACVAETLGLYFFSG